MAEAGLNLGALSFVNGRHRFAWMRDHGATAIPICVDEEQASEIQFLLGSALQICRVALPWREGAQAENVGS